MPAEYLKKAKVISLILRRKLAAEAIQAKPRGHTEDDDAAFHYSEGKIAAYAELLEMLKILRSDK